MYCLFYSNNDNNDDKNSNYDNRMYNDEFW